MTSDEPGSIALQIARFRLAAVVCDDPRPFPPAIHQPSTTTGKPKPLKHRAGLRALREMKTPRLEFRHGA